MCNNQCSAYKHPHMHDWNMYIVFSWTPKHHKMNFISCQIARLWKIPNGLKRWIVQDCFLRLWEPKRSTLSYYSWGRQFSVRYGRLPILFLCLKIDKHWVYRYTPKLLIERWEHDDKPSNFGVSCFQTNQLGTRPSFLFDLDRSLFCVPKIQHCLQP